MSDNAWGGRFGDETDAVARRFTASVDVDHRLAEQDILGSLAHVRMLAQTGVLSREDAERIVAGLEEVAHRIADGSFEWDPAHEDVHMGIEAALTASVGDVGGRLHTARSRNDQVATDLRMWTRDACRSTSGRIDRMVAVLVARAAGTLDVLMPGYTHLQRAQPVRLAHHVLAWCEMLERDRERLLDAARRMNECPLGSGALAATTFPIDREATADELGFERPCRNSIDGVSARDFVVEALAALANCALHLSRISEELVLWSSQEFGFVEMSDAYTTGSSMMPQKKNPDMAELVRGKTGRVIGSLVTVAVVLKGLPLAYNRDMQEDKPPLFDAFDTVNDCLLVLTGAIATARFDGRRMRAALREGFIGATELADWLTSQGVPFRQAHHAVGRLVAHALFCNKELRELTLPELRAEHPAFDQGAFESLDPDRAVERRDIVGGPARARVSEQIAALVSRLAERGVDVTAVARDHGMRGD